MIQKRLIFIDCLRGLCMLLVVYHHIIVMGMRSAFKDGNNYVSYVNNFATSVQLPLFFFISGFVAYKVTERYSVEFFVRDIIRKSRTVLIPTVLFFFVCMLFWGLDVSDWIVDDFKCGYWFTWVLFQIFLIWNTVNLTLRHYNVLTARILHLCLALFLLVCSVKLDFNSPVAGFLSISMTLRYYMFFVIGALFKSFYEKSLKIILNKFVSFFIFIITILPNSIVTINVYLPIVQSFIRVLFLFIVFYHYKDSFSQANILSKVLTRIGTHTLSIYFCHYFLLFNMSFVSTWLMNMQCDYCFRGNSFYTLPELFIVGAFALIISYCCMLIEKIVDACPILSELLFGKIKN